MLLFESKGSSSGVYRHGRGDLERRSDEIGKYTFWIEKLKIVYTQRVDVASSAGKGSSATRKVLLNSASKSCRQTEQATKAIVRTNGQK